MQAPLINQPLNDAEFDRIESFLEEIGSPMRNLEMLDGFFSALICGPNTVLPNEYFPLLFGDDHQFDSKEQAIEVIGLVLRHWNTIASTLARSLDIKDQAYTPNDLYFPVLYEDEDGVALGNDWAHGFMRGIALSPEDWEEIVDSSESGGPLLPILILYHENDPDPTMRPPKVLPEERKNLIMCLVTGLANIYCELRSQRHAKAQMPFTRQHKKVGRNDPCPCGSSRKYKHCCASNSLTLH